MTTSNVKSLIKISQEIYDVLAEIVGKEYISMDPAICEGYRSGPGGYESGLGYERVMTCIPGCVILPGPRKRYKKSSVSATASKSLIYPTAPVFTARTLIRMWKVRC